MLSVVLLFDPDIAQLVFSIEDGWFLLQIISTLFGLQRCADSQQTWEHGVGTAQGGLGVPLRASLQHFISPKWSLMALYDNRHLDLLVFVQ